LFKVETSATGGAAAERTTETLEAPAAAGNAEEVKSEPASPADDIDFGDATPENAKANEPESADAGEPDNANAVEPASPADDVDFMDAAPDDANADEPDKADADEPADEMPAKDATEDDATLAPEESVDEDAPADPKSSEVDRHDTDASLAQSVAGRPAAADGMRLWTDNTGKHQVRARLVMVLDGKVRLEKETGRFTTVPFERLSMGDLAFVRHQAPAVASTGPQQTARNQTGLGW
jgi:hypothetical protein